MRSQPETRGEVPEVTMAHGTGFGREGSEREAQRERAPGISFASAPKRVGMRPSMWHTSVKGLGLIMRVLDFLLESKKTGSGKTLVHERDD